MTNLGGHRVVILAAALSIAAPLAASAQEGPGGAIVPQRDCQTILTCNFKKGGSFRGCLSSYSCRVCGFVPSRCTIGGRRGRLCSRLRCSWGSV